MELKDIKPNAIYNYDKGKGWCKHGIVYTYEKNGKLLANDTYWDSKFSELTDSFSSEPTTYDVSKIYQDLEFVMMVDEVKEIPRKDNDAFYQYDEKDRLFIPMGGWHERYLVDKNVTPRKDYKIEQLEYKIGSLKSHIRWKQDELERLENELREIKNCK